MKKRLSYIEEQAARMRGINLSDTNSEDVEPEPTAEELALENKCPVFEGSWGIYSGHWKDHGQLLTLLKGNCVELRSWNYFWIEQMRGVWNYKTDDAGGINRSAVSIVYTRARKTKGKKLSRGSMEGLTSEKWIPTDAAMSLTADSVYTETLLCCVVKGTTLNRHEGQEMMLLRSDNLAFPPTSPKLSAFGNTEDTAGMCESAFALKAAKKLKGVAKLLVAQKNDTRYQMRPSAVKQAMADMRSEIIKNGNPSEKRAFLSKEIKKRSQVNNK